MMLLFIINNKAGSITQCLSFGWRRHIFVCTPKHYYCLSSWLLMYKISYYFSTLHYDFELQYNTTITTITNMNMNTSIWWYWCWCFNCLALLLLPLLLLLLVLPLLLYIPIFKYVVVAVVVIAVLIIITISTLKITLVVRHWFNFSCWEHFIVIEIVLT